MTFSKLFFLSLIGPFCGVTPNFEQCGLLAVIYSYRLYTMYTTSDGCKSGVVMVVVVVLVVVVVVVVMVVLLVVVWWW